MREGSTKEQYVTFLYQGKLRSISEIARMIGMLPSTLHGRVVMRGWSLDLAVKEPTRGLQPRRFTHDGKTMTVQEWSLELGLSSNTLYDRIRKGYPLDRVFDPRHITHKNSVESLVQAWDIFDVLQMPATALCFIERAGWRGSEKTLIRRWERLKKRFEKIGCPLSVIRERITNSSKGGHFRFYYSCPWTEDQIREAFHESR